MGDRKAFLLRLDPRLFRELESWAQAEFRSVNGQIESILKRAVERRKPGAPADPADAATDPSPDPS